MLSEAEPYFLTYSLFMLQEVRLSVDDHLSVLWFCRFIRMGWPEHCLFTWATDKSSLDVSTCQFIGHQVVECIILF